jgi:hypothetical protein
MDMFKKLLTLYVLIALFPIQAVAGCPANSYNDPDVGCIFIVAPLANATVPEPSTIALFGLGVVGIIGFARRRKS